MLVVLLLMLPAVRSQLPTPSQVEYKNFQRHPFNAVQFVPAKPTKKGPILFPNDAPPPPPPPLIVTARPLAESIARSELNPNNSLAAQSQRYQVSYRPEYQARAQNYKPYAYTVTTATPGDFASPYAETVNHGRDRNYDDYEPQSSELIARRALTGDDAKSTNIKVKHESLYSREVADYNEDDGHHNKPRTSLPDDEHTRRSHPYQHERKKTEVIEREVQLLYEVTGNGHDQHLTTIKSGHPIKERYKIKNRLPDEAPSSANAYYNGHKKDFKHHGENYAFSYAVKDNKTGDDFSHSQQSTGTSTNGEYRVRLPDGRMQIVSYTADEDGYKADVRYDHDANHENSIDDLSRENHYHDANDASKNINSAYDDHLDDLTDIADYAQFRYKANKPHSYGNTELPINNKHQQFEQANDFIDHTNYNAHKHAYTHKTDYTRTSDFAHKNDFSDTTKIAVDDIKSGLTDNNDDYLEHYDEKNLRANAKTHKPHEDDYLFTDEIPFTKEVMDYSNEFNHAYQPHKSKFSSFGTHKSIESTVRPSYDELKDIFVTNGNYRRQNSAVQVGSTLAPSYEERKPNLYTSIRDIVAITPAPITYSTPFAATPRGYLISTIANLKHQVNLAHKPVLSRQYINKINKYLSYK